MSFSTSSKRSAPPLPTISKKPRFSQRNPSTLVADDSDNEPDVVLDADVIGTSRSQHKRNAVNIDGYDSDSDRDNFDRRASKKARDEKLERSREEDENDMFAELKDDLEGGAASEGEPEAGGKKKKGVRFVHLDDMADLGQEFTSKSGGHVSSKLNRGTSQTQSNGNNHKGKSRARSASASSASSSSSEEVPDEIRATVAGEVDEEIGAGGKKHHAPKLDAFNMRDEQSEGAFDDQGNYIRKAIDPDAVHDVWLEGLSKKEMRKAKEAMEKREEERRKKEFADDATSVAEVLKALIPFLERGETVLEALARLGGKKKARPKWQTKQKNRKPTGASNGDVNDLGSAEDDPAEAKRRQDVESITAAADLLLTKGQADVYDTGREMLVREYSRETGEQWKDPEQEETKTSDRRWEYRWTDARDGGNANGPYDSDTMRQWQGAGYFGEGVEFRIVGAGEWSRLAEF